MSKLIKNILVPTDFNDHSEYAFQAAIKFARKISGQIYLYHRIHLHPDWNIFTDEEKECHPNLLKKEEEMMERFNKVIERNMHSGIRINSIYSSRDLMDRAEQLVDKFDIDLVVMGSEGADGLKEMFLGSNAQKVSNVVDVPVLIIKHPIGDFYLKDVVFASDFNEDAKQPFTDLIRLLQNFGSTLHLLYIASVKEFVVQEETLEKMRQFEKLCWALPCQIHGKADQSVELGVQHYMTNSRADLLCVVHHQKGPFEKIFRGSVSGKLINHLECPVLSLPADEREFEKK